MNKKIYDLINNYEPFNEKEKTDKKVMLEFIKHNSDILTRDNKIGHFTVSAWITNKEKSKILMIYHNIYKSWAWVGGHVDGIDDFLMVIKREIEEETGLSNIKLISDGICGINIITVDAHIKNGKIVNSHLHFDVEYMFEACEHDKIRIKEDENSGVKWISINEVCNYSSEERMKDIYKTLNEKLKKL